MNLKPYFNNSEFARICQRNGVKLLSHDVAKQETLLETKQGHKVLVNAYNAVFLEIFCLGQYDNYKEFVKEKCVLFDLGANRGYSALLFASDSNIEHVHCYEPVPNTFDFLRRNVSYNAKLSPKITLNDFGLSDETKVATFYTHPQSDGISTGVKGFVDSYWATRKDAVISQDVSLKLASEEIEKVILENSITSPLVLKIDTEGGEYAILKELQAAGTLDKFSVIIGECHLGMQEVLNTCQNFTCGFLKQHKRASDVSSFILVRKV